MDLLRRVWARVRAIFAVVAFAPTRRLAVLFAVAAPLWLLGFWPWGAVFAGLVLLAIIVALVVDVAMLPGRHDVIVRRLLDETVGVGDTVEGRYEVQSLWDRPLYAVLHDDLPAKFLSATPSGEEERISARGQLAQQFSVTGVARGVAPLGVIAVTVRTPLGLAARTFRYEQNDQALVTPSLAGVKRFRWLAVHHRLATVGVRATRRRGEGRSFARLRDYVVGDDPRHIDWKATARRGQTTTREFTVEQSQTVFILVDAGRSMTQIAGRYPRFEYALSASLLLADVASTAGDRVGALVFDDKLRALIPAQRGGMALSALRNAMIPLQPTLVEPDYATAFRTLAQRQRKRSLVVLITDVIDARTSRSLLAHLARGVTRHLVVVVALRNEALRQTAATRGATARDLYTSGAAEELIAERVTALQRMRDAGVVVLDVAPEAMAAAMVNEYLELKSRGAL
jgi:uncharacterized protein (DUF58 family)